MQKSQSHFALALTTITLLAGCASSGGNIDFTNSAPVVDASQSSLHSPTDLQKIGELEKQIARDQRQCLAEKRRLETSLKESQKQNEDLQKKVDDLQKKQDALLAIDRDLRNRNRNR